MGLRPRVLCGHTRTDCECAMNMFVGNQYLHCPLTKGWLGMAMVSGILRHRGVQLILASSWARPAILVAGKDRGERFLLLFLLFLLFHSCSYFFPVSLFYLLYYLFYLFFSLYLGDDTKWPTRVDVSLDPNTINQSPNRIEGYCFC